MQYRDDTRRTRVLSFDRNSFNDACAALMNIVSEDRVPDVLIGIRTGGMHVADAMARALRTTPRVLPITCRRPSTKRKPTANFAKSLVATLPRPLLDSLRVVEHALLTRSRPAAPTEPYRFDAAELAGLDSWAASAGRAPFLLVVDDAVDTGATLAKVLETLRNRMPPAAIVRSAVITVTTEQPLAFPDYHLLRRQLCRFPWSLDAKVAA